MAPVVPLFKVAMDPAVKEPLDRVLQSGFIAQGPKVDEFERALSAWVGRPAITVNSGTSAIALALRLAGVTPGSQVISTPMTCSATNLPILAAGAEPVWADIDPRTGLIDPDDVERKVGLRTKAIIAVDWGGQPCDYDTLMSIGRAYGVPVISDAAHSFGAFYKDRPVGTLADYTTFSFQAIKHLTTGDGGALTVPAGQEKRAKTLRWFGIDREASPTQFRGELDIEEWGYKAHMNDIAATIGLANLPLVDGVLRRHRANATLYNGALSEKFVRTQPTYEHEGSWWIYTTLLPTSAKREQFRDWMIHNGVQASQVHWRNDELTAFARFKNPLPGVAEFAARMICLPAHWATPAWRVVQTANAFFGE